MYATLITVLIICALVIGYIYYNNKTLRAQDQQRQDQERELRDKQEMERVRLERLEKQRLEKERVQREEYHENTRKEILPLLEKFLVENDFRQWLPIRQEAKAILAGDALTVQELLQHNVNRRFPDGSSYKVGIIRKTASREISLPPDKVEALQAYFVCFLDFFALLKSKGIKLDKLQLHSLLEEAINHRYQLEQIK